MSIPLPTLFAKALSSASKALNLPTIEDATQEIFQSSLNNLTTLSSRLNGLSLFSPNESLEDISTKDLVYLLVPYACAEVQSRLKASGREEQISSLRQRQRHLQSFLTLLESYDIIPETDRVLYERNASSVSDPAKRRELKIKQYQKEKELRTRIQVLRKRRRQVPVDDENLSDFDLILSLLPVHATAKASLLNEDDEDDAESDEVLRETTLILIRLMFAQAQSELKSMDQELELLLTAPPEPSPSQVPLEDSRLHKAKEESSMWKLDAPIAKGQDGDGPLLDPSGKPLRPFTILPAGAADRAKLQAQVFGPGHRLPTMSIDEYLQIERERGNIITGGGAASAAVPTTSEQLALDSEMDGTQFGEERADAKRIKDENWAIYTDNNPKGAGNTMNRG